jgi:hypothetical protein
MLKMSAGSETLLVMQGPMRGDRAMTSTNVEILTVEAAKKRRDELLQAVGGDEQAIRERAADYALQADELAALNEIDELDYLLGG